MNRKIETPVVSICCSTFNHSGFIRDAIEGFLSQKVSFPIEILIHDDASTDGTADIIHQYEKKYPDLIRPIYQVENQFSKGVSPGWTNRSRARGKYIALCEGDDYWTDPLKLQKQVDFLEQNTDYAICCHAVNFIYDDGRPHQIGGYLAPKRNRYTLRDLCVLGFIATASAIYRNNLFDRPSWFNEMPMGDWPLHILNAEHGDIWFIDEVMANYRVHKKGYWSGMDLIERKKKVINAFHTLNSYLERRYEKEMMGSIWQYWLAISQLYEAQGMIKEAREYSWKCISNLNARGTYSIMKLLKNLIKVYFPGMVKIYRGLKWLT